MGLSHPAQASMVECRLINYLLQHLIIIITNSSKKLTRGSAEDSANSMDVESEDIFINGVGTVLMVSRN